MEFITIKEITKVWIKCDCGKGFEGIVNNPRYEYEFKCPKCKREGSVIPYDIKENQNETN